MIIETQELRPMAHPPRRRWGLPVIATVVALTVAIGGVVGAYLVNGRGAGAGTLTSWAPADAAIYAELDLTLPGAQRANVAALLDHWSALNPDLLLGDEFAGWVDDMIGGSGAPVSYADDLAPWLSGTFALVMSEWPAMARPDPMRMRQSLPEVGIVIGTRDEAAAAAFVDQVRDLAVEGSSTFSSSDHGGVTIWSLDVDPSTAQFVTNAEVAYAVTDGAVLIATGADEVGRLLDTHAGGASLATDGAAGRLMAALPADRIGLSVMDTRAPMQQLVDKVAANAPELAASLDAYLAGTPPMTVVALSVEADRVVVTSAAAVVEGPLAFQPLSEALAERIPAGSLFYASAPNIGPSVAAGIDTFLAALAADEMTADRAGQWLAEFESATGVAPRDLFGWADDMALYAGWNGAEPVGGVIALTDDPAGATAQLDALVDALASAAGASIRVERDGAVTQLIGSGMPTVEIAVSDDAVTITVGSGEATRLAAVEPATSLAGEDRPAAAMAALGGAATDPAVWLDLAGIIDAVTEQLPEGDALSPERMVIANLEPLDHAVAVTRIEDGITITRMDLVVR
ncbi:MAG: DUF3352 domain-containing protein [Chloroflexota bacterium]